MTNRTAAASRALTFLALSLVPILAVADEAALQSVPPAPITDETAGKTADLSKIAHSPKDASPYLGAADALVVVNVFTDFQCPVCKRAADPIKQLVLDYPDKVKVVFRNNALPTHGRSQPAALAAMAAGQQGKFWEYYDRIFANPSALDDASLAQSATALGLDLEQWNKDIADPKSLKRIQDESAAAIRLGVPGTPGIFVNGYRQVGWGSYLDLRATVGREITAAEALVAKGTKSKDVPSARVREMAVKNVKKDGEAAVDTDAWAKVLLAE